MARYIVTGGAGFIGSALARRLLASGHEVVILDNLSTGKSENIPSEATFVRADLSQPDSVGLIPSGGYDAVFHLAAQSSGAIGQKNPYADMQANVGSTMLLSSWCLSNNISRFIYASSMTVYGQSNRSPLGENAPTSPISYYGASKLASENYLRVATLDGLRPTCLRLYNVYGPGQNLGNLYQGMASIYLAYMLNGNTVPVTGSFSRYRDFCYVDDVVSAFCATLSHDPTPSMIYNIGTGRQTTVGELLQVLTREMRSSRNYEIQELPGSPSDVFGSVADSSLATRELQWKPMMDLEEGIRRMVTWAKDAYRVPSTA